MSKVLIEQERIKGIVNYCRPHVHQMWAAMIIAILFDGDFRDAPELIKRYDSGEI